MYNLKIHNAHLEEDVVDRDFDNQEDAKKAAEEYLGVPLDWMEDSPELLVAATHALAKPPEKIDGFDLYHIFYSYIEERSSGGKFTEAELRMLESWVEVGVNYIRDYFPDHEVGKQLDVADSLIKKLGLDVTKFMWEDE